MAAPNAHVSIVIYKGDPLDYQMYRHTSLWIEFTDESTSTIVHITGTAGIFQFEAREDEDPANGGVTARQVDMGLLSRHVTSAQIVGLLRNVSIDNSSREFNCQTWVEQALAALVESALLSKSAYDVGLDGMVDAIAEAGDE